MATESNLSSDLGQASGDSNAKPCHIHLSSYYHKFLVLEDSRNESVIHCTDRVLESRKTAPRQHRSKSSYRSELKL